MSAIALVGGLTMVLRPTALDRLLLPFIALAAGTLMGGAFFHMIPGGSAALAPVPAAVWLLAGFTAFLGLEQFLHWHQSHRRTGQSIRPVNYLILTGDAIHNFVGGLSIASTFLLNPQAGMIAWVAAAAHELPQELGDFGILVRGGFSPRRALFWNLVSALSFPVGALLAYHLSHSLELSGLILFGAGNFIYIAASDLVPEIKTEKRFPAAFMHFSCFVTGLAITLGLACVPGPG